MLLGFVRPERVEAHIATLAGALGEPAPAAAAGPRATYHALLNRLQPRRCEFPAGNAIRIEFDCDDAWSAALLAHFLAGFDVPRGARLDAGEQARISEKLAAAVLRVEAYDRDAARALRLLIGCVLVVRTPSFGSLADALGAVLFGPDPAWPVDEYAELLWHEAVHQALFLEDMLAPVFAGGAALAAEDALVENPILGVRRPFDLAFHGAVVSAALHDFYDRLGAPERALEFGGALAATLDALVARRRLLTERGRELLDELRAVVAASPALRAGPARPARRGPGERRSLLTLPPSLRAG
jgi:hypothetical protein